MAESRPLEGKIAVITGAGRGIGRAIAVAYAGAGASICCAARTQAEIDETVELCRDEGSSAIAVQTDVKDYDAVETMMATTAEAFGGIDIVVINAGISIDRRTVEESNRHDWQTTLDVNLTGAYNCAKIAIPYLRERGGGKIITIGSGMGHKGRAGSAAYCCSKAGLWMLTRTLAQELWPYNISVNELIPGPVVTEMAADSPKREGSVFNIESEWIKGPQAVVPLALFLASQPEVGPSAQSFSLMRRDN